MITIVNETPSTIKIIGTILKARSNCKILFQGERVRIKIKNYQKIIVKSKFGKLEIVTFEDFSSIVNYGKLRSCRENDILIVKLKPKV